MKRNFALDGLRGYAALSVIFYHAILGFDATLVERILNVKIQDIQGFYDILTKILLTIFNGETAVIIFFILSGVVLFDSLKKQQEKGIIITSINFLIRRIIRIYPAVITCLIFFYVAFNVLHIFMPNIYNVITFRQLVENSLLYKISMHGATWTLQTEMLAIPFILLGFYINRYIGTIGLILYFGYSLMAYENPSLFVHIPSANPFTACLVYFVIGFLIPTKIGDKIYTFLEKKSWYYILPIVIFIRQVVPRQSLTGMMIQMIFASMLVGIVYYNNAGYLGVFLEKKVSVFLGRISFSLYLINVVFLNIFYRPLAIYPLASKHYLEFGLILSILTIIFTIPLSYYSEKYIERPSIKLGHIISEKLLANKTIVTSPNKQEKVKNIYV